MVATGIMKGLAVVFALVLGCAGATAQTPAPALPGGASSLQETFEDWQVSCAVQGTVRLCRMAQQQRQKDGNQLVLAVELAPAAKDGVAGLLVLPFGLRLADGVTLQIDEGKPSPALAFSTCLPGGCLVPLGLDAGFVRALRSGAALKIGARANDGGQAVALAVSLKGFAAAHDRLKVLAGS